MSQNPEDTELDRAISWLREHPKDEQAWRILFNRLWPFVLSTVWKRLRDPAAAEDAAQDVFVRLAKAKPFSSIENGSQMRAYVWRMALNAAFDRIKARKTEQRKLESVRDLSPPNAAPEPSLSEDHLLFGEVLAVAKSVLVRDELDLLGHVLQGHSLSRTAADLGQSYSTTAVRLHRLREKLHKLLF